MLQWINLELIESMSYTVSQKQKVCQMEQQILRKEYIDAIKRNLSSQLDNISIQEKDGSITDLGKKHGHKKGN